MSETRVGLTLPRPVTLLVAGVALAGVTACGSEQGTLPGAVVQHAVDPNAGPDTEPSAAPQEETGLGLVHYQDTNRIELQNKGQEAEAELPPSLTQGIFLLPRELPLCDEQANPEMFAKTAQILQMVDGSLTPERTSEEGSCWAYSASIDNPSKEDNTMMFVAEIYPESRDQSILSLPYIEYGVYNDPQLSDPSLELPPDGQVLCDLPDAIKQPFGLNDESYVATKVINVEPGRISKRSDVYGEFTKAVNDASEAMCRALGGAVTQTGLGSIPFDSVSNA